MPWRLRRKSQMWGCGPPSPTPRLLRRGRLWRQNHFAAGLLDRRHRRRRGARDVDRQLGLELALGEQPDRLVGMAHQAGGLQRGTGDVDLGVEPPGLDRGLDPPQIDDLESLAKNILEAALGQPPMQRHLAALEALDPHAGARLLALDAAARGLAQARADAAAVPLLAAPRARIVADLIQLHDVLLAPA